MGQRSDEPDTYRSVKSLIEALLAETDLGAAGAPGGETAGPAPGTGASGAEGAFDPWLMAVGNIDLLFDCFQTEEEYQKARRKKEPKPVLHELKPGSEGRRTSSTSSTGGSRGPAS